MIVNILTHLSYRILFQVWLSFMAVTRDKHLRQPQQNFVRQNLSFYGYPILISMEINLVVQNSRLLTAITTRYKGQGCQFSNDFCKLDTRVWRIYNERKSKYIINVVESAGVHKMERISRSLWIITKHANQTTRLSQLISPDYLAPSLQQDPTEVINFIRGYVIWCTRTWFPFKESKCKLGVVHSIHFT